MKLLAAVAVLASLSCALSSSGSTGHHVRLGKTTEHWHKGHVLRSKYGKGTNIPIGGNIWPVSIYWTYVSVGTPLKQYAVAIDSGSFAAYLSGTGCNGCITTPPNTQYNASASSTSVPLGRNFSATYETCDPTQPLAGCTISGPLYNDMASLAGYGPTTVEVGVIEYQTSNFYQFQTIDGIMGMVGNVKGNVFNELCIQNNYCSPVWGICMIEGSKSNGTMTIGGVDDSLADGVIPYVPRANNSQIQYCDRWWCQYVSTVNIHGEEKVSIYANQDSILDTGTNDLLLPTAVFNYTWKSMCADPTLKHCHKFFEAASTGGTACFNMTQAEVMNYPDLTFDLKNGVSIKMTAKDYLLQGSPVAPGPNAYCFGISNGGGFFIFGDSIMQNYYLIFAPTTIGWGKVNKDTCGSK